MPIRILCLLLVLLAAGCGGRGIDLENMGQSKPTGPLRVVVVDDAKLAATIGRMWAARTELKIEIRETTLKEFASADKWSADIVIYPPPLIGQLVDANRLLPISPSRLNENELAWVDILPLIRLRECTWNKRAYATPFGSRTLVLLYRADIFDKLKLKPPTTWLEFDKVSKQLSNKTQFSQLVTGPEWAGSLEPLGKGSAAVMLLARAASYARYSGQFSALFDFKTMEPLIGGPPFVRALKEMIAANHSTSSKLDVTATLKSIIDGKCAMAITWPLSELNSLATEKQKIPSISAASIPGGTEVYSVRFKKWDKRDGTGGSVVPLLGLEGRIGSVTRESRNRRAAFDALTLLSNREWSELIAPTSANLTIFRRSHLQVTSRWVDERMPTLARSYGDVVESTLSATTSLSCLRIPGRDQYLQALDDGVRSSLAGKTKPQAALQAVADKWKAITKKLDAKKQRRAYGRSIGLDE